METNSRRKDELMFSFKQKYDVSSCKCFQIAHGSLTKAVCLPNRGRPHPLLRAWSESCVLISQNPNPTDRTSAPLDAPRSNDNPQPFREHMYIFSSSSSKKMFSNSTRFTQESSVPTKLWSMPPLLRAWSESCILIGRNLNPTDHTSAPLDAPRSNSNPHPFRQEM